MNSLEEIRQTVATTLQTLHNVVYSATPIIWPNFMTVDMENLTGSFVSVEITIARDTEMFGVGENTNIIVRGELVISYLRPAGAGLTGAMGYSDMLLTTLCNRKLSGVTYFGLQQYQVSPYPGVVGVMNRVAFCV